MSNLPNQYRPGIDDPLLYDQEALSQLIQFTSGRIETVIETLFLEEYEFASMSSVGNSAIDVELIYRQCMPAAAIARAEEFAQRDVEKFLVLFVKMQTLILNHVDRHLDLSSSYALRDPHLLLKDPQTTMSYVLASLYSAIRMGCQSVAGARSMAEMSGITLSIVQSMYDNYSGRYNEAEMINPKVVIDHYADETISRHLGSGFYSSSILGLMAYVGRNASEEQRRALRQMRRLRQRVDELSDLKEDCVTGLITYPVAVLLESEGSNRSRDLLKNIWDRSRQIVQSGDGRDPLELASRIESDLDLDNAFGLLMARLVQKGILEQCQREAELLWMHIRDDLPRAFDPGGAKVLSVIIDLKRAFLDRLAAADWIDLRPQHSFLGLRERILGV